MLTIPVELSPEEIVLDDELNAIAALDAMPAVAVAPFRIAIDVNEGVPYRFTGIKTDGSADKGGARPLVVRTITLPLYQMGRQAVFIEKNGRQLNYVKGLADYSIEGMIEDVQIERKSLEDLYGTLGGRRDDFEAEIARLNLCRFAAVVIEASWSEILFSPPDHSRLNPKTVSRTILSWSIRYPGVHWFTCSGRQHAEAFTFRLLEMFWRQQQKKALVESRTDHLE